MLMAISFPYHMRFFTGLLPGFSLSGGAGRPREAEQEYLLCLTRLQMGRPDFHRFPIVYIIPIALWIFKFLFLRKKAFCFGEVVTGLSHTISPICIFLQLLTGRC